MDGVDHSTAIVPYLDASFELKAQQPIYLPEFKGSVFRGGFGRTLKNEICPSFSRECLSCSQREKCDYAYLFETPIPSGSAVMRKYQKGPHPFVLEPPQSKRKVYSEGENLHFHMILLGRAVEYLPLIIRSFLLLGNYGIGQKNGKYRLEIVRTGKEKIYQAGQENINKFSTEKLCITPNGIDVKSASQSEIDINFITQTHIIYREKSSDHPEFHMVIRNLLRRISLISYFHCGGLRLPWDFKIIIKEAEKIKIKSSNLIWKNTERYSYRQQKEIPISGVTGAVKYQGNIPPFLSLLKAGELLHIGKGTSMGLGKIKIKVLN